MWERYISIFIITFTCKGLGCMLCLSLCFPAIQGGVHGYVEGGQAGCSNMPSIQCNGLPQWHQ